MKKERVQISASVEKEISKISDELANEEGRSFSNMVEALLKEALIARGKIKPKTK